MIVSTEDPVSAALALKVLDIAGRLYVTAADTKLLFRATVIDAAKVPSIPAGTLQTIAVSEDHDVAAQGVLPTRPTWDEENVPKSDPKTIKLPPPSVGPLVPPARTASSNETVSVPVPCCRPLDNEIEWLVCTPAPTRMKIQESEIHLVETEDVRSKRDATVLEFRPNPLPVIETETAPVEGKLLDELEIDGVSMDRAAVKLLNRNPTLKAIRWLIATPCPNLQATEVSDCQIEILVAERPILVVMLDVLLPKLDPKTVTTKDPDDRVFLLRSPLKTALSMEYEDEALPAKLPKVRTSRCDFNAAVPIRQPIEVAEIHDEASTEVPLSLPTRVMPDNPNCEPKTEMLMDPLAWVFDRKVVLSLIESVERTKVELPNRKLELIMTTMLRFPPCDKRHTTEVSDW
jgi:hypothetical protein